MSDGIGDRSCFTRSHGRQGPLQECHQIGVALPEALRPANAAGTVQL